MTYHPEAPDMASRIVTPLRLVVAILVVLSITVATVVVLFGPEDGRWGIVGALGASPDRSESASTAPSPSPTTDAGEPSASASPSLSRKEKNIAEAKASLEEYYKLTAEVANDGYADWERKLAPFWIKPATRAAKGAVYERNHADDITTAGSAFIVSMVPENYKSDDTDSHREEVTLRACIDFREVRTYGRKGDLIPRDASVPMQYEFSYVMRNQGPGREWAILVESPNQEKEC